MSWPLSHEFNEAIQNPHAAFADPDLRTGETVVGATGLPLPRSGNFADVYQMRGADGREWAVKCFTRPVAGLAERYARVGEALAKANLPFVIEFSYLAEGIRVGGVWRPAVKMEWVEGFLLNQVVRENAAKPTVLGALGQLWVRLGRRLREAGVAHADIQHGNVLLVPGSRPGAYGLKLIDYDGMWVPALANTPSGESGHPAYQHPGRAARSYSPDVDRFPHLVIATALKGVAVVGPALWAKYDNGDNLLFNEGDFKKPAESALMKELWHTGDPAVQALVGRLAIVCGKPIPQTPWLDQLAPEGEPTPLDDATRRAAAAALGVALPVPTPLPPEPQPLPPEPMIEVVAAAPVPVPIPVPGPAPVVAGEVDVELVTDVELVAATRPDRTKEKTKKAREPRKAEASGGPTKVLLFAAGGLLLVGGVVAAVVFSGGKKPPEAAQEKQEDPKENGPKPPVSVPKPKDQHPNPVVSAPKDAPLDPVVSPAAPTGKSSAVQRWAVDLDDPVLIGAPVCSCDGGEVAVVKGTGGAAIYDARTGKRLESPTDPSDTSGLLVPLNGRFAGASITRPTLSVWDPRAGKVAAVLQLGGLPVPGVAYVSPTGRYYASSSSSPTDDGKYALKLRSSRSDSNVIVDTTWSQGTVHFTDDEKRVLVAARTGECRWFKLPSGEPDGEWRYKRKGENGVPNDGVRAVSGDGSTVLIWDRFGDRPSGVTVTDGAGQRISHFPNTSLQGPSMSRDGRLVLIHSSRSGAPDRATVLYARTGLGLAEVHAPADFPAFCPVLLPDGRGCLALASDGTRRVLVRYDFVPSEAVAVVVPGAPAVPGEPPALKNRWTAPTILCDRPPHFTSTGTVVFATSSQGKGTAFDVATGEKQAPFTELLKGKVDAIFPLTKGRVGTWAQGAADTVSLWDERTGASAGKLQVPTVPRPNEQPTYSYLNVSRNARYAAIGWVRGRLKPGSELELKVFDLETDPVKAVVSINWTDGRVHFTADSSRVLVSEYGGRCRWFKLPGGEPDGEWALPDPGSYSTAGITSMSDDGSVLGYYGPRGLKNGGFGGAAIDGKTGAFLHFTRTLSAGSSTYSVVSGDGRRIAVPWTKPGTPNQLIDVADTRTGSIVGRIATDTSLVFPALSPDGTALALSVYGEKPTVQLYDVPGAGAGVAVVPKPPEPKVPEPDLPELKTKWSIDCKTKLEDAIASFDEEGQTVAIVATTGALSAAAFNAKTGAAVRDLAAQTGTGHFSRLFPLDKGKFGFQADVGKEYSVWEPGTGKINRKPFPVSAAPGGVAFLNVSANERYLTVGSARPTPGAKNPPESPLKVIDTTTGKAFLSFDWHAGATAFTADSSRVLVVDDTDKFRWFTLPGGKLDGEWAFERAPDGRNAQLLGLSARGEVILYHGCPTGKEEAVHLLDGRDGTVLCSFPAKRYAPRGGAVSDDGRNVMLITNEGIGTGPRAEILDARGTPLAAVKLPPGTAPAAVAVSWKARTLVTYDRSTRRLTAYDLPAASAP